MDSDLKVELDILYMRILEIEIRGKRFKLSKYASSILKAIANYSYNTNDLNAKWILQTFLPYLDIHCRAGAVIENQIDFATAIKEFLKESL